jgi:hypothetical protein
MIVTIVVVVAIVRMVAAGDHVLTKLSECAGQPATTSLVDRDILHRLHGCRDLRLLGLLNVPVHRRSPIRPRIALDALDAVRTFRAIGIN